MRRHFATCLTRATFLQFLSIWNAKPQRICRFSVQCCQFCFNWFVGPRFKLPFDIAPFSPFENSSADDRRTVMKCSEIAAKLEKLEPACRPQEISRLCTSISNLVEDSNMLYDEKLFAEIWNEVNLRLSAATDQHSAMVQELKILTKSAPKDFTADQIWILVRAIKVQSQMLRMYGGDPVMAELN